jgi:hypothetical protein
MDRTLAAQSSKTGEGHRWQHIPLDLAVVNMHRKPGTYWRRGYPTMQPTMLVSRLEDTLGWQWSMQFNSADDKTVFWDSVSVAEIRKLVASKNKVKRTPPASGLQVVRKNPKSKK